MPECPLCAQKGRHVHRGLTDQLFGATGDWDLSECQNSSCGLLWLDPMPLATEIWKAYLHYYTHTNPRVSLRSSTLRRWFRFIKEAYWATKFGYNREKMSVVSRFLGRILYISPLHRRETEAEVRLLSAVPNGKLLDVGCGSGEWLLQMKARGWRVEGVDFDKKAVDAAGSQGIAVKHGSLEQQRYPDNSFDAVTLSHVIEHVPMPLETVAECFRILKPGGRLVMFTPNGESLSHKLFKRDWRGLEPPRHLHIFTLNSMNRLLRAAGFSHAKVSSFIVTSVVYDSLNLWSRHALATRRSPPRIAAWLFTRAFKILELILVPFFPRVGDCVIGSGYKPYP